MSKNDATFESLARDFSSKFNTAFYNMTMVRTREEAEVASADARKVVNEYAKMLKQVIDRAALQIIADHANMIKMLNDRFNLDPDKAQLSYEENRNTIRWTVTLIPNGGRYYFMSKRGLAVDMTTFYNWCVNTLLD